MDETFDREKIIDCMFDPITSEILAKLEDGKKECSILSEEFSMSESDILQRLDYLIECEFIFKTSENQKYFILKQNIYITIKQWFQKTITKKLKEQKVLKAQ